VTNNDKSFITLASVRVGPFGGEELAGGVRQEVVLRPQPRRRVCHRHRLLHQRTGIDDTVDESLATIGLYNKTIMIVIMMVINDATIWSITYDHN
jgi:hypothetical protein